MQFYQRNRFLFLAVFYLLCASQTASAQIITREKSSTEDAAIHAPKNARTAESEKSIAVEPRATDDFDAVAPSDYQARIESVRLNEFNARPIEKNRRHFDFGGLKSFDANDVSDKSDEDVEPRYVRETASGRGFNYRGAFTQSLMFLGIQHGFAIATQQKTRDALKHGPFWRDYADSVKSLHGWNDGGRFFTNYIAHPLQGAFTGHIYVQNSPQALREEFSMSTKYWKTRAKAMLWTTAWSTQFEIGPISQASIGNVGLKGKQTWEDIVVTPTAGTTMLIAEDAIDRYLIKSIERRTDSFYLKIFARVLLNPTRNFSNLFRFREPWYRDRATAR